MGDRLDHHRPAVGHALPAFTAFVRRAVERYGSRGAFWAQNPTLPKRPVTIWDIWNEPWGTWAWKGSAPDGGAYARMFKAVVEGARPADPEARFMAEVETFTNGDVGTSFVHAMFDAVPDLGRYMDMASHHPYPEHSPPAQCRRSPSGDVYERLAHHALRLLPRAGHAADPRRPRRAGDAAVDHGDRLQHRPERRPHGHRDAAGAVRARRVLGAAHWGIVDGMLWYHYKTSEASPTNREDWFGLVHPNGTPKPAWSVFTQELKAGL